MHASVHVFPVFLKFYILIHIFFFSFYSYNTHLSIFFYSMHWRLEIMHIFITEKYFSMYPSLLKKNLNKRILVNFISSAYTFKTFNICLEIAQKICWGVVYEYTYILSGIRWWQAEISLVQQKVEKMY